MAAATNYRLQLNNYLQEIYKSQTMLSWTKQQLGPEHESPWEATAWINHVEHGKGIAHSLDAAKEEAARRALVNLRGR